MLDCCMCLSQHSPQRWLMLETQHNTALFSAVVFVKKYCICVNVMEIKVLIQLWKVYRRRIMSYHLLSVPVWVFIYVPSSSVGWLSPYRTMEEITALAKPYREYMLSWLCWGMELVGATIPFCAQGLHMWSQGIKPRLFTYRARPFLCALFLALFPLRGLTYLVVPGDLSLPFGTPWGSSGSHMQSLFSAPTGEQIHK